MYKGILYREQIHPIIYARKKIQFGRAGGCIPSIDKQYTNRDLFHLVGASGDYFLKLVLEFNASCQARQDAQNNKGHVEEFPCLPYIQVRGVEVDITPLPSIPCLGMNPLFSNPYFLRRLVKKAVNFNRLLRWWKSKEISYLILKRLTLEDSKVIMGIRVIMYYHLLSNWGYSRIVHYYIE